MTPETKNLPEGGTTHTVGYQAPVIRRKPFKVNRSQAKRLVRGILGIDGRVWVRNGVWSVGFERGDEKVEVVVGADFAECVRALAAIGKADPAQTPTPVVDAAQEGSQEDTLNGNH